MSTTETKKKRVMTEEQLEILARARQRAIEVRREKADLKRKEKELRHLEEATRADEINQKYKAVKIRKPASKKEPAKPAEPPLEKEEYEPEPEPEPEESGYETEPEVRKPKPKPKPRARPPRPPPAQAPPAPPPVNQALEDAYQSLFRYRY